MTNHRAAGGILGPSCGGCQPRQTHDGGQRHQECSHTLVQQTKRHSDSSPKLLDAGDSVSWPDTGPDGDMILFPIGDVKVYFFYVPIMTVLSATASSDSTHKKKTAAAGGRGRCQKGCA